MALSPTAFVISNSNLYFTYSLTTPIGSLLEGIWNLFPDQARSITRERIYTRIQPSILCDGILKVAGKRHQWMDEVRFCSFYLEKTNQILGKMIEVRDHQHFTICETTGVKEHQALTVSEGMKIAEDLSQRSSQGIASVLLSPDSNLISWGWNDHFKNRIHHAEVILIKNHFSRTQKAIPSGSTLITTRFPCAMCAAYLHHYCEDFSSLKIVYRDDDPGPFAQNSILIPGSHLHQRSQLTRIPKIIHYLADQF